MSNAPAVMGSRALLARMHRIRNGLPDAVFGADVQHLLLRRVLRRFEQDTAPDGTVWAPLTEATVLRKKRRGDRYPDKALVSSGRLLRSIGLISGATSGLLTTNTGLGFRLGVKDAQAAAYGRLHQYGLGVVPKRTFIGLASGDVAAVREFAKRRVARLVG